MLPEYVLCAHVCWRLDGGARGVPRRVRMLPSCDAPEGVQRTQSTGCDSAGRWQPFAAVEMSHDSRHQLGYRASICRTSASVAAPTCMLQRE